MAKEKEQKKEEQAKPKAEMELLNQDVLVFSEVVAMSKTGGIFSPDENTEWTKLHRALQKCLEGINERLKQLATQMEIKLLDGNSIDIAKTGEEQVRAFKRAEQNILQEKADIEIKKFISSETKVYSLKDKNDYTTGIQELITKLLVKDEDGSKVN